LRRCGQSSKNSAPKAMGKADDLQSFAPLQHCFTRGRRAELAAGRVEQAHDTSLVSDIGFVFDVILHGRKGAGLTFEEGPC